MSLRAFLRVAVGITISCVSVYLVTRAINVEQTYEALLNAEWQGIATVAGLLAVDVAIRGYRWRALLTPIARLPSLLVTGHLLVGYLANNALPARLGEFVRAISLADRERLSRSAVFGSVLVERLLDVAALAVAVLVGLSLVAPSPLLQFAAVVGLAIGILGLLAFGILGGHGSHSEWLDRIPAGRLRSMAHGLRNGVAVVRDRGVFLRSVALTAITWMVTAVAFEAAAVSVGLDIGFDQAFFFAAAVNLATAIPAGPGYVGTFELAALSVSVALGIPAAAGLAMGLIVHVATLAVTTVGGITAMALLHVAPNSMAAHTGERVEVRALAADSEQESASRPTTL